jgi:hypothetical protein
MKTGVYLWQYLAEFFLECKIFQTKFAEEIKIHISCSKIFSKLVQFLYEVGKFFRAEQATDDNMAHAHCMLGT